MEDDEEVVQLAVEVAADSDAPGDGRGGVLDGGEGAQHAQGLVQQPHCVVDVEQL